MRSRDQAKKFPTLQTSGQFLNRATIGRISSIYTALVEPNHSVTMIVPMIARLRNWPLTCLPAPISPITLLKCLY